MFAYDLAELGRFHRGYQALMAHWRKVLPASHVLEVHYEAVVEDVESEARRLLDFLGLPWHDAVLRFHETERPVRTASANQVREPIYRTSAGRWRRHAAQLAPLLDALGVEAPPDRPSASSKGKQRVGYDASANPSSSARSLRSPPFDFNLTKAGL